MAVLQYFVNDEQEPWDLATRQHLPADLTSKPSSTLLSNVSARRRSSGPPTFTPISAISLLREYRAALISAAVTGQLDIRQHEKQLEALA